MIKFGLEETKETRVGVLIERGIYAFMIAVTTIAVAFVVSIFINTYFNDPPILVTPLSQPPNVELCASSAYGVELQVTTKEQTIVSFYLVVRDKNNFHYVDRNQTPLFSIPTEKGISFKQVLPWRIPSLPPGEYTRIVSLRGHNSEQTPLVFTEDFTIGPEGQCEGNVIVD